MLNKIDLPGAEPEKVREQIEQVIGIDASEAIEASAKNGVGIDEILEAIVQRLPPPEGRLDAPLRALVFDSWYDQYRGVVVLVHVVDGRIDPGARVRLMATGGSYEVEQMGVFTPKPVPVESLEAGRGGLRDRGDQERGRRGDRRHLHRRPATRRPSPSPASRRSSRWSSPGCTRWTPTSTASCATPWRSCGLNDASFFYEPETSAALGFGFRCGFLGLLHMEIVRGAAGAGVRPRPAHHRPLGALPRPADRRRGGRGGLAGPAPAHREHRGHRGADHHRHHPHRQRVRGARSSSCARTSAASRRASSTSPPRGS